MSDEPEEKAMRSMPVSELQMQYLLAENEWGKEEINPLLKEKLTKKKYYVQVVEDEHGKSKEQLVEEKISLWETLSFLTRDVRLGNLNFFDLQRVRNRLRLAHACLVFDLKDASIVALGDAAIHLETSQSYSGFLRRRPNTLRTEKVDASPLEPRGKDPYYRRGEGQ